MIFRDCGDDVDRNCLESCLSLDSNVASDQPDEERRSPARFLVNEPLGRNRERKVEMPRTIVPPPLAPAAGGPGGRIRLDGGDDLSTKLVKYVPAETLAFFVPAAGRLGTSRSALLFAAVAAGAIGTVGWLWYKGSSLPAEKRPLPHYYVLSVIAFLIWALVTAPNLAVLVHLDTVVTGGAAGVRCVPHPASGRHPDETSPDINSMESHRESNVEPANSKTNGTPREEIRIAAQKLIAADDNRALRDWLISHWPVVTDERLSAELGAMSGVTKESPDTAAGVARKRKNAV